MHLSKHKVLQAHDVLAGGVVSSVRAGTLTTRGKLTYRVAIKQTNSGVVGGPHLSHSDHQLIKQAPRTHKLDIDILTLLQNDSHIRVPKLHHTNKRQKLTVMADFRAEGYELMQDLLVANRLPLESAAAYGEMLARLHRRFDDDAFANLKPVENVLHQMRGERLQEIHVLSYDNLDAYRALEAKLLEPEGLIYPDGHPKNTAVNAQGQVMIFDFGRSVIGSRQYPAPNFAAHIGLAMLGGCIEPEFGRHYIQMFCAAYRTYLPIEEEWFVQFFVAELLHRGLAMRWIDKRLAAHVRPAEMKVAAYSIYLQVINPASPVTTVDQLLDILAAAVVRIKVGIVGRAVGVGSG